MVQDSKTTLDSLREELTRTRSRLKELNYLNLSDRQKTEGQIRLIQSRIKMLETYQQRMKN